MYPGVELRGVGHPARAVKTEIPRFARDDNRRRVGVAGCGFGGCECGEDSGANGRRVGARECCGRRCRRDAGATRPASLLRPASRRTAAAVNCLLMEPMP